MITRKICKKYNNILSKLNQHPATSCSLVYTVEQLLWHSLQEVCKHGYSHWAGKDGIHIPYNKKNYAKYKKYFDKELKESGEKDFSALIYADVPYEVIYGEKWKFDHVEYWGEMSFVVFHGKDLSKYHDIREWQLYHGVDANGRTYEELLINIGKKFLKTYGEWTDEDFLTKKEYNNHQKYFMFKNGKKYENKDGFVGHTLERNPKYIRVETSEINRRWLKWFVTTDYCKKNWSDSFDEILNLKVQNEKCQTKKSKSR